MPDVVWRSFDRLSDYASHLDRQHWIVLSVAVLVMGLICMRGFGSRKDY